MIKQNVFFLSGNLDNYTHFLASLKHEIPDIQVYTSETDFFPHLESLLTRNSSDESSLFILFIDHCFLKNYLEFIEKVNPLNCMPVLMQTGEELQSLPLFNIYESINPNSEKFDFDRFIKRLNSQIKLRVNGLSLQYEIKEFYKIGKSLTVEKDTFKLLETIIDSSINITSSDAGTIYLVIDKETGNWSSIKNGDYNDRLLKFVIARNTSMNVKLEMSTSPIVNKSISGQAIISGKPIRIEDAYNIPANLNCLHNKSFDFSTGYKTISVLTVPMKDHEDNIMGVIQLINKKKNKHNLIDYTNSVSIKNIIPFDPKDEMMMESLAGQAAVALENNLLYRQMNTLLELYKSQNKELEYLSTRILKAHEEERKRIAREIHDGPAQSVANLCFKLELCKKYFQTGNLDKLTYEFEEFNKSIRSSVKEIRTIIYDLKPSYLEDGLIKALENHLGILNENSGIKLTFNISGDDSKIEYYLASTIYRIVQEALSNVLKYAHAQNVTIDLDIGIKDLSLIVIDDGDGFDTSVIGERKPHKLEGGFGLEGMMERVEIVKGKLEIKSAPGRGTKIIARIPLN